MLTSFLTTSDGNKSMTSSNVPNHAAATSETYQKLWYEQPLQKKNIQKYESYNLPLPLPEGSNHDKFDIDVEHL